MAINYFDYIRIGLSIHRNAVVFNVAGNIILYSNIRKFVFFWMGLYRTRFFLQVWQSVKRSKCYSLSYIIAIQKGLNAL